MARKNAVVSVSVNPSTADAKGKILPATIQFNVEGHDAIIFEPSALNDDVTSRAMYHGLIQKVSDAAALGKDATPSDKHAAMLATVTRLLAGDWNKRADGDGSSPVGGIIFRALRNTRPETDETKLRAWYESKSRAEQLALRNVPAIATEIERIKSERGAGNVEPSNLVNELDNL